MTIFQTLDTRQHKTGTPERRETNENESDHCPDSLLKVRSQPQYRKEDPDGAWWSPVIEAVVF